jgi:hypothetical protein
MQENGDLGPVAASLGDLLAGANLAEAIYRLGGDVDGHVDASRQTKIRTSLVQRRGASLRG